MNYLNAATGTTGTGLLVLGTAPSFVSTVTIGTTGGTTGAINLKGTTSGTAVLTVLAAAGTPTITLPTVTGTLATLAGTENLTNKTINGLTPTAITTGFTIAGGTTSKTLTVNNTIGLSGTDGSTLNIGGGGTLGTNAYTSTAYAPLASPTFTGTVTIPSPFTVGATSVTSTGTQLNYLNSATGTTGTGLLVLGTAPSLASTVTIGTTGGTTGAINLKGTTSGTAVLTVLAAAGTPTITLPTVTGTLATLAGAETFTNKTGFNGMVITPNTGVVTTGTWNGSVISASMAVQA